MSLSFSLVSWYHFNLVVNLSFEWKRRLWMTPNKVVAATICVVTFWRIVKHHSLDRAIFFYQNTTNWTCYSEKKVVKCKSAIHYIIRVHAKGQIKSKSRLAGRRFSQKRMDEFDLFAVKSKKANKSNSSVRFLGEVSRP